MRLFAELNQSGATIVLVTHDMSVAARARRVLRFRCGCLEGERLFAELDRLAVVAIVLAKENTSAANTRSLPVAP